MGDAQFVEVPAGEVATGETRPVLLTAPAELNWRPPRVIALAATTARRLVNTSRGQRLVVMIRNLNAATNLQLSTVSEDIATQYWQVDPLDTIIMNVRNELWGYAAAIINVNLWEADLEVGGR